MSLLVSFLSHDISEYVQWRTRYLNALPERKKTIPEATLRQIFATQTYYALILKRVAAQRLVPNQPVDWVKMESADLFHEVGIGNLKMLPEYHWYLRFFRALEYALDKVEARIVRYTFDDPPMDTLKTLYQDLFKRQWRHTNGEYFTPDWLADFTLNQLGYVGEGRLLDPSCGTGTFLMLALRRLLQKMPPTEALRYIWGIDINPLAVLSAQVNIILAIGVPAEPVEMPISWADSIFSPPHIGRTFDFIAGNPPWINQETLPENYRLALTPSWEKYGLFVHTGIESILGKGKKDLSMLMTYAAADMYLKDGGKLGFIVSPNLFKSGGAGAGFRRFSTPQMSLKVLSVDDVSALNPFPEIESGSAVLLLQKGEATQYPADYRVWRHFSAPLRNLTPPLYGAERGLGDEVKNFQQNIAIPINPADLTSPWLTGTPEILSAIGKITGSSDYVAHAGVYTGGANGVYWLEILETLPDGCLRVRNIVEGAKRAVSPTEAIIEPDFVYPLLRGQDVRRWQAIPTAAILVVQHPQQRRGYAVDWLQKHYPLTYAYLLQFEKVLRTRATYKRYFQRHAPFYTMFDVGDYTFAPVKVVWQGMGNFTMQAAVVAPSAKSIMPNQAMHPFVALDNEDEAHYLTACLNSAPFTLAVRSHTQPGGKSFAQPGILKVLRIPRYETANPVHQQLSRLSRNAHAGIINEQEIDILAARVWGLSSSELEAVVEALQS